MKMETPEIPGTPYLFQSLPRSHSTLQFLTRCIPLDLSTSIQSVSGSSSFVAVDSRCLPERIMAETGRKYKGKVAAGCRVEAWAGGFYFLVVTSLRPRIWIARSNIESVCPIKSMGDQSMWMSGWMPRPS